MAIGVNWVGYKYFVKALAPGKWVLHPLHICIMFIKVLNACLYLVDIHAIAEKESEKCGNYKFVRQTQTKQSNNALLISGEIIN